MASRERSDHRSLTPGKPLKVASSGDSVSCQRQVSAMSFARRAPSLPPLLPIFTQLSSNVVANAEMLKNKPARTVIPVRFRMPAKVTFHPDFGYPKKMGRVSFGLSLIVLVVSFAAPVCRADGDSSAASAAAARSKAE